MPEPARWPVRLARLGLSAPEIEITEVPAIERYQVSAKLKRFVPLN